jgi:hypothetical protein
MKQSQCSWPYHRGLGLKDQVKEIDLNPVLVYGKGCGGRCLIQLKD